MCGIAGYIAGRGSRKLGPVIQAMTDAVAHRGPDDSDIYISGSLALGHRRLSIIDLSKLGRQPMRDKATGCVIVYNGEIYNYIELRGELIDKGYKFRSQSDTEVILKAYACWGEDCVTKFNGMWSFAIYDPKRNGLFCSRDRFGEKPFYYADLGTAFAFGSEIRQLLPLLPRVTADTQTMLDYLHVRDAEPETRTFFKGISKLPGGHNLIYDLPTNTWTIKRYYGLEQRTEFESLNIDQAVEQFLALFEDSVRLRMRADVRVGTCLSGGLDSSSVASIAAPIFSKGGGGAFSAITAVSEDPAFDESAYAKLVVDHAGLAWMTIKPSYDDFCAALGPIVRAQEEPFASASAIMQYYVMKEARRCGIPVLLDGQGGDETLLGYHRYFSDYCLQLLKEGRLGTCADFLFGLAKNGDRGAFFELGWNLLYFHVPGLRSSAMKLQTDIFESEYLRAPGNSLLHRPYKGFFDMQKLEIERTSLPALLRFEDKNAMWHSIETRLPFLDHRLVEFVSSLAPPLKMRRGWGKYILRRAVNGRMPEAVTWRKSKLGFTAPESKWQNDHRIQIRTEIAASPLLAEICRREAMTSKRIDRMSPGLRWRLFSVALWAKEFSVSGLG